MTRSAPASLVNYQFQMVKGIYGEVSPPDSKLRLYRGLTRLALQETLDAIYPLTRVWYPKIVNRSWEDLGEAFITGHPPRELLINCCVRDFAGWLDGPEWMKDLADYEWTRFQVGASPDAQSDVPTRANARYELNPSLAIRRYRYPVARFYRAALAEGTHDLGEVQKPDSASILIFRDPTDFTVKTLQVHSQVADLLGVWAPETTEAIIGCFEDKQALQPIFQMLLNHRVIQTPG